MIHPSGYSKPKSLTRTVYKHATVWGISALLAVVTPMAAIVAMAMISQSIVSPGHADQVYVVKYASRADKKVYVTKYASRADCIIYRTKYASRAQGPTKWHIVRYASRAKLKIFYVKYESRADLKVFFTPYESRARCR